MIIEPNRRHFLASTIAVASAGSLGFLLPVGGRHALAATPMSLIAERRVLDVKGRAASVFGIRQPNGIAGLVIDPGQRFLVNVANRAGEDTVIHWHGQTPPNVQDGVTETGSALIKAGTQQGYDFAPRSGTHWMHSHHGLQEQQLMAAPLVVRSAKDLRQDAQEVTVLLHDFSFRDPAELLADLVGGSGMPGMAPASAGTPAGNIPSLSATGHMMPGRRGMPGAVMHGMQGMQGMSATPPSQPMAVMPGMTSTPDAVQPGAMPDLNDITYDAYLANDRTLDDPLVIRTERNGRIRLRLINGAASTAFWIDLGGATAIILAVDGNAVQPIIASRFPLAQAQRLDLLITMPAGGRTVPVLAQREGDRVRTGVILATPDATVTRIGDQADAEAAAIDLSIEQRLVAVTPLAARAPGVTHRIALTGAMMPYVWSINDKTWDNRVPLSVAKGQRVVLEMLNRTPMAHPMHLHGHHFQVVALNGTSLSGAVRDTVLVPGNGTVAVAFDADNPGRWVLHCHNMYHMAAGMMTEIAYDRST